MYCPCFWHMDCRTRNIHLYCACFRHMIIERGIFTCIVPVSAHGLKNLVFSALAYVFDLRMTTGLREHASYVFLFRFHMQIFIDCGTAGAQL